MPVKLLPVSWASNPVQCSRFFPYSHNSGLLPPCSCPTVSLCRSKHSMGLHVEMIKIKTDPAEEKEMVFTQKSSLFSSVWSNEYLYQLIARGIFASLRKSGLKGLWNKELRISPTLTVSHMSFKPQTVPVSTVTSTDFCQEKPQRRHKPETKQNTKYQMLSEVSIPLLKITQLEIT